jgi:hypothetical protein
MTWIPSIPSYTYETPRNEVYNPPSEDPPQDNPVQLEEKQQEKGDVFATSEASPYDGLLDPVIIEQVGYTSTGTLAARTDDGTNTEYSIPLDDVHSWVGSRVDLNVRNLKKLFVLNGSFSEGTVSGDTFYPNGAPDYYPYGWGAQSTTGYVDPEVIQSVSYENTGSKYIVVQSKAKLTNNPQHWYTHYNGTTIYWNQSIDIIPTTTNFLLSFDYLYQFGPINGSGPDTPAGTAYLEVIIDGRIVYSLSLYDLTERNSWFSSGVIPIRFTPSTNPTTFMIGIKTNSTFILDADDDYDYTPGADGSSNAEYITVWFDDVSFTAETAPSFDQVDLQLAVEGTSKPITGSNGVGSTTIPAPGYWTTNPVNFQVTSNTTVSFEYEAILRSHRFSNSTWMTDNTKTGVQYTVQAGASPELTFNTYIGFIGGYINLTTRAWFPSDWENVTVFDPFLADVTSSCSISANMVEIPTSLMDRLGWWRFNLDAPNYAKSIKSQIHDGGWTEAIPPIFRISDETRADITIGTATETLGSLTNVNVTWFNPSGEIWESMTLPSGGVLGQIYSGSLTFNASSPAGEWWVEVYWTNGTEVAYDMARFEIHHSANLVAIPNEISTDAGATIKGIVEYRDNDTNDFLLDSIATLEGNWTGSTISFNVNPVRNWWEADFDTSLASAGVYVIEVKASQPYYDNASCQIIVRSTLITRLTSPNAPWASDEWGNTVSLTYVYDYFDPVSKMWSPVQNLTGLVSASVNWSGASVSEATPGVYVVQLQTSAMSSGSYLINATFANLYHQSKQLLLTLIVAQQTSSLSVIGDFFARVDIEESFEIKLSYTDSGGNPVLDGNMFVTNVYPSTGLNYSSISQIEQGNFTITLTPLNAGVFTIRFLANSTNAERASTIFVLVVNDVATKVDISGPGSKKIGLTDVYDTTFRYELLNGTGIPNAIINITYSGGTYGALSSNLQDLGGGDYSIEFSSIASGTYLITIAAFKQYYQRATDAFFLVVGAINTTLSSLNGTADTVGFGEDYQLFIRYTNTSGYGLDGASIFIASAHPGLNTEPAIPHGEGVYSILLTPLVADTFSILLNASLFNHETAFAYFTITGTPIGSSLVVLNSSATVSFDHNFTVYMFYQNEDLVGLENATIEPLNPPLGLIFSNFSSIGNGFYTMIIGSTVPGNYLIRFIAHAANHFDAISAFVLSVTNIPTQIRTDNGLSSASAEFLEGYDMFLFYERADSPTNISLAMIQVNFTSVETLDWSFAELGEGYLLHLETDHIGRWDFTVTLSRLGYQSDDIQFVLFVNEIAASLTSSAPSESLFYGNSYSYTFQYTLSANQSVGISRGNVTVTGPGSNWIEITDLNDGRYNITITPRGLGIYQVPMIFSKYGYQTRAFSLEFTVDPARITMQIGTLVWHRQSDLNITVTLIELQTEIPVSNATVTFKLYHSDKLETEGILNKVTDGVYATFIQPKWYDGTDYSVYVFVEKANYILATTSGPFTIEQVTDPDVAVGLFLATVVPPLALSIGLIVFAIIGQVVYRRRKKSRLAVDLVNKRRFDDADNLIGVIVLHKKSGIPIYSKIPKGGFEEGIVAAFVSAVTHFREEFEMFDEEQMQVIPISDIIRAVQTKNLICAFVTVRSASIEQNRKMEAYAMQVGTYLDDLFEDQPSSLIDEKISEMLDFIFDSTMDGNLVKYYKVSTSKPFPKRYKLLERLMKDTEIRHCSKPVYLAQGIATYGVTQARGCTLVLEAINLDLIHICEEHEVDTSGIDFKQFFRGSEERANSKA